MVLQSLLPNSDAAVVRSSTQEYAAATAAVAGH
jgi:hypothetical protein